MSALRRIVEWFRPPTRPADAPLDVAPDPSDPRGRAAAAHTALERTFRLGGSVPAYLEEVPWRGERRCYLWPLSRVASATLDALELGIVDEARAVAVAELALEPYHRGGVPHPAYDSAPRPPVGPGGDRFYDDNAWVALDLLRLHELTGRGPALDRARELFAFLVSGWDDAPGRPRPGGVRWVESASNLDRNTVSTVPAAQVGYHLHRLAGDVEALRWADRMLGWASEVLRDPEDGLFWDHVDGEGRIETTKWSYNQGSVVGAELAGFRTRARVDADRAARHLARAEATATAMLAHYTTARGGWLGQGLPFNAIAFRDLLDLRRAIPTSPLAEEILLVARAHADEVWRTSRGPDGLFRPHGGGRTAAVIDQAAAVEIQAAVALADPGTTPTGSGAEHPPDPGSPAAPDPDLG